MKIEIVYVFPVTGEPHHFHYAMRFLESYHRHPPGVAHDTVIIANGGPPDDTFTLFQTMPNMRVFQHDDSGFDIGAYQAFARTSTADMCVFLGGSTYCRRAGWLIRMAAAFADRGKGNLYGAMGNLGDLPIRIWPHIRTTGFWCAPALMNQYPTRVTRYDQRHPFEYGPNGFTQWVRNTGRKALVVDFSGVFQHPDWNKNPNGFHRGTQADLLIGDRITESPIWKGLP